MKATVVVVAIGHKQPLVTGCNSSVYCLYLKVPLDRVADRRAASARARERVPGGSSELKDLWDAIDLAEPWRAGVEELRAGVGN